MPILTIKMMEGRTDQEKRLLVAKLTDAVCETLTKDPENVRVVIEEMPGNGYAIGGKLKMDTDPKYKK